MIAADPEPTVAMAAVPAAGWRTARGLVGFAVGGVGLAALVDGVAGRQAADVVFGRWPELGMLAAGGLFLLAASIARALQSTRSSACAATATGIVGPVLVAGAGLLEVAGLVPAVATLLLTVAAGLVAGAAVAGSWSAQIALGLGALAVGTLLAVVAPSAQCLLFVAGAVVVVLAGSLGRVRRAQPATSHRPASAWRRLGGCGAALAAVALLGAAANRAVVSMPLSVASVAFSVMALGALAAALPWHAAWWAVGAFVMVVTAGPGLGNGEHLLATQGPLRAVYQRANQELQLQCGRDVIDANGPDRSEAALAATLVMALTTAGDRVLLVSGGCGRAVQGLSEVGERVLDVVDPLPAASPLRARLAAVGPVLVPGGAAPSGPKARVAGLAPALAALGNGARQAILLADPLTARATSSSREVQEQLRRVVADGVVLQVVALDRTPAAALHALFAAVAGVAGWHGLFVVGDAAVLVSAAVPFDCARVRPFANWSSASRWLAHEAHLGDRVDLQHALLGTLGNPPPDAPPPATARGRAAALEVLRAWLVPVAQDPEAPSVLRRWSAMQAELRAAVARLRALPDDASGRDAGQAIAARFLHLGAPRAELQAALGLVARDGSTLRAPGLASRIAQAIDPTVFVAPAPVFASLPRPAAVLGELEDLAMLPPPARLAERASGQSPMAVALRARFPSRCARALVLALASGPLPAAQAEALRELADPFVLREAGLLLLPQGRVRELLGCWRGDLPMPAALGELVRGSADDRRTLAAALRGRNDPSCHPALADLLVAAEPDVRMLAGEALRTAVGERIAYDPNSPQSAREAAAQQLRSLHNRAP